MIYDDKPPIINYHSKKSRTQMNFYQGTINYDLNSSLGFLTMYFGLVL